VARHEPFLRCADEVLMSNSGVATNVLSKSLLNVRGMEGRVSSNLKGGACVRLKARI